jgi:hypothetical protein
LAKKAIFQDLPLMPQGAGEERWRWLHGQLRAAILTIVSARRRVLSHRVKQHGVPANCRGRR